jgi:hypothetical protein
VTITAVGQRQFIDDLGVLAQVLRAAAPLGRKFSRHISRYRTEFGLSFYL